MPIIKKPVEYKVGQVWSFSNNFIVEKIKILAIFEHTHRTDSHYVVGQNTDTGSVYAYLWHKSEYASCGTPKLDILLTDHEIKGAS